MKMIIADDDLINQQDEKEKMAKKVFDECSEKMKTRFNNDNAVTVLITTSDSDSFFDKEREKFLDVVSEELEMPKEMLKMANDEFKELEILKLKEMLEKANIPFKYCDNFFEHYKKANYQIVIFDKDNKQICDAICFYGSYGYEQNLLEIMGALTEEENEDDSVLGYLTADEVFKRFKYCYEHNANIYVKED